MSSIDSGCDCIYCPAKKQVTGEICRMKLDSNGIPVCRCDECHGICDGALDSDGKYNGDCDTCFNGESQRCEVCPCCNDIHTPGGTYMSLCDAGEREELEASEEMLAKQQLAVAAPKKAQDGRDGKQRGIKKVKKVKMLTLFMAKTETPVIILPVWGAP